MRIDPPHRMSPSVTVVLATADLQLSYAVHASLLVTSDIQLVGAAPDVNTVISAVSRRQPRLLIVDLALPQGGYSRSSPNSGRVERRDPGRSRSTRDSTIGRHCGWPRRERAVMCRPRRSQPI